MSMHNQPESEELKESLVNHGLPCDKPSQLADAFRCGWAAFERSDAIGEGWPNRVVVIAEIAKALAKEAGMGGPTDKAWPQFLPQAKAASVILRRAFKYESLSLAKEWREDVLSHEEGFDSYVAALEREF